ncbi:hypothetical protein BGZ46_001704 [Entomortierella lignicola]|nr:hypothetical protein BGZ46_001704 [Entomortierella lignicola]
MPPPSSARSAFASVKYHVQQWVNLVLYNSIYQNIFLLHLYRIFKFIYGFFDRSTELSRICGANNWYTPLDSLWDKEGDVISSIVNEKHTGTIVYTNVALSHLHTNGGNGVAAVGGRRGSVQAGPAATTTDKNLVDSPQSTLLPQDSGSGSDILSATSSTSAVEEGHELSGLKHRKKGRASSVGNKSSTSHIHMDLRQARSAAGLIYRIDRCILFSKQLTLERRELELPDNDPVQITHQILLKKKFPDGGSPDTSAAKKLQYALERIASTHQLAREINQRVNTKYDSTNPAHERKLMLLWELLRPQEKLEGRYTKQWVEIGFQGKDPATDFRGMGYLFHRFNDYWTTLEPKPSVMDFERVFADFRIMMERQLARRKLMMLHSDTKENLGTSGYSKKQQQQRRQQSQKDESIELEDKKSNASSSTSNGTPARGLPKPPAINSPARATPSVPSATPPNPPGRTLPPVRQAPATPPPPPSAPGLPNRSSPSRSVPAPPPANGSVSPTRAVPPAPKSLHAPQLPVTLSRPAGPPVHTAKKPGPPPPPRSNGAGSAPPATPSRPTAAPPAPPGRAPPQQPYRNTPAVPTSVLPTPNASNTLPSRTRPPNTLPVPPALPGGGARARSGSAPAKPDIRLPSPTTPVLKQAEPPITEGKWTFRGASDLPAPRGNHNSGHKVYPSGSSTGTSLPLDLSSLGSRTGGGRYR